MERPEQNQMKQPDHAPSNPEGAVGCCPEPSYAVIQIVQRDQQHLLTALLSCYCSDGLETERNDEEPVQMGMDEL